MREGWESEIAVFFFSSRDPNSEYGAGPLPLHELPILQQSVDSVSPSGVVSKHVVVRNLEQTADEAALSFCRDVLRLHSDPLLANCHSVLRHPMRIEAEAADLADLKKIRLF
jgi:hypothetical protein